MARAPVGQRIRKRRQQLGISQLALAASIGISPSYLNLIEHNKRAIGGALLNRIAEAIDLDSRALAGTEEARLIAELGEMASDPGLAGGWAPEMPAEVVAASPEAARAILAVYRAYREARIRSDMMSERLGEESFLAEASRQILTLITTIRSYAEILKDYGDLTDAERRRFVATLVEESETLAASAGDMFDFLGGRGARRPRPSPQEEVDDFVSDRANYFPVLEKAAEETHNALNAPAAVEILGARLRARHGISIERVPADTLGASPERVEKRNFMLSDELQRQSVRFRLARLIGSLEYGDTLDKLVGSARLSSVAGSQRLRRALAGYFAAALLMPYVPFQRAAEQSRLDILRLVNRFDTSFEQVCHRLTTLRRPGAEGVPLHFLRTDVAGNISKRFSASGLRLPRYGGACPRWIVHQAFASPGRIVRQLSQLPDGGAFFSIARTTGDDAFGVSRHAVMVGLSVAQIGHFVYGDGFDSGGSHSAVPIGITCRQCPRGDCIDRAFDQLPLPGSPDALAEAR